jgi:rod shape-determining protein MreC
VPRQRTARLPLLSPSAPRSEGPRSRGGGPIKARLVAVVLVFVSLALITIYFRESSGGALHGAQRIGVSALAPFEIAGERVARPFRDAYGYVSDLFGAKQENAELRAEIEALRHQVIQNETAAQENEELRKTLNYIESARFPDEFNPVVTQVIVRPQDVFRQEIVVAAGSKDGIQRDDPVVTEEGLVGTVVEVAPKMAKVRLLTDQQSAASALVLETQAAGIVVHGPSVNSLILDRVPKDDLVEEGDIVVTAGSSAGKYESLYPRGIAIGIVTAVSQRDVDFYKRVQIAPLVEFDSLEEVVVLVDKGRK